MCWFHNHLKIFMSSFRVRTRKAKTDLWIAITAKWHCHDGKKAVYHFLWYNILDQRINGQMFCSWKKNNLSFLLLLLHIVAWSFQFPDSWQVLEIGPDLTYPELHSKVALDPIIHLPFIDPPLMYITLPCARVRAGQVSWKYNDLNVLNTKWSVD